MGEQDRKHPETQRRLLESACRAFAAKGYRDATIAEICEQAGANIAAVNYHFGDKATLYVEAWRLAFQRSLEAYPADGGVAADAPAEARLRGRIGSLVERMSDPQTHEFDIVHKELANPTGLLVEVMRECIEPIRRGMRRIVRELLGEKASDQQVQLCQMSIIGQCFHPMMRERHRPLLALEAKGAPGWPEFGIETITDHIVRFSLKAIGEIRRQCEGGDGADLEPCDE